MKVNKTPRILRDPALQRELEDHATLINLMTDGSLTGTNNAMPAAPLGGMYARGDYVRNSLPAELGAVGSKYVVLGFVCILGGTPGTFVQCRALTGN